VAVVEENLPLLRFVFEQRDLSDLLDRIELIVAPEGEVEGQLAQRGLVAAKRVELPGARAYRIPAPNPRFAAEPPTALPTGLRILVVSPLYGGSYPVAGYVTRAFEELGHRPVLHDNAVFDAGRRLLDGVVRNRQHRQNLLDGYVQLMAQAVLARALEMEAQLVFFLAQSPVTEEAVGELRRAGIPTAFWFVEDASLFPYGEKIAHGFDVFFHIQRGPLEEKLRSAGARRVHYLPMAADPTVHRPLQLSEEEKRRYGSELSHVGAGYHNRRHFFASLSDYDFKVWGSDWEQWPAAARLLQEEGRRVSTEEAVKIFNASSVNLNLHSSTFTEGVNPQGDFVNPRTFEVAATGAFQLVDQRALLGDLFEPGREVATFQDLRSCRRSLDHYLAHPEERAAIAQRARERVLAEHTYRHRMEEALAVIFAERDVPFLDRRPNTVARLVEEAGDDRELAAFFRRMGAPEDELSLPAIAERIRKAEGELGETEAIFLLMDEFHRWAGEKGLA
jgi:spore maturation protein CgeB